MTAIVRFFTTIYYNRKAFIGFILVVLFVLMAIFGPVLYHFNTAVQYDSRFLPPSFQHPLGTDYAGRDTWTEIVIGSRGVLQVAFWAALISLAAGVVVGTLAGFVGGALDQIIVMIINVVLTIPGFSLNLILAAIFAVTNPVAFGLLLSITAWAPLALGVRAQILSLRERDYITVAKLMGMDKRYILFSELMPNIMSYLTINFIQAASGAVQASVGIMLLGLAPYSVTNWGQMLNIAINQNGGISNPSGLYYMFAPILALVLFTFGCFLFANGIDDFFNPRLRQ
ncbi:MAG: ABC transporter permease [Alicyclobacillus sp.]|nr:ABC transporter permease [Alicyclobacillus sp.]